MFRIFTGPETEAIVMFGGDDDLFHAGIPANFCPLIGIQFGWIEQCRIFRSITPFLISKCVNSKMDEGRKFQLLPGVLSCGRRYIGRFLHNFGHGIAGIDVNNISLFLIFSGRTGKEK